MVKPTLEERLKALKLKLVTRFEIGDPLSDQDCRYLLRFFKDMEEGCLVLGRDYALFEQAIRLKRQRIEGYLEARKWSKG